MYEYVCLRQLADRIPKIRLKRSPYLFPLRLKGTSTNMSSMLSTDIGALNIENSHDVLVPNALVFYMPTFSPQVAVMTAKVALKAGAGLELEVSDFLKAVTDGFVKELVGCALDEEMLSRFVSGEDVAGMQGMQRDVRTSYAILKNFMNKEELKRRGNSGDGDGFIDFRESMQRVGDGKGGLVWVRKENVLKWRDSLLTAAPSM